MKRRLILASTSPRRRELFSRSGLPFDIVPSDYEEDMTLPMPPRELVARLAKCKAGAVSGRNPDAVVIGADTFVVHDGRVLGKPHTAERAREMLKDLSGTSHSLITGFSIMCKETGRDICQVVETKVYIKELSPEMIEEYIATGDPLDKAGAYAIQTKAGKVLIEKIEGSFDNAVGLPMAELPEALEAFDD